MANIDAMKLLGSLLGSGALSRGSGAEVLNSVIGAVMGGGQPRGSQASTGRAGSGLGDLLGGVLGGGGGAPAQGGVADLLGGLLGGGRQTPAGGAAPTGGAGLGDLLGMAMKHFGAAQQGGLQEMRATAATGPSFGLDLEQAERQAEILVRAMINAAKSDGKIDQAEEQKIVQRLGEVTPDELDFVRREIAAPLDVQDFVHSVPRGMEQQVYTVSLMAIDLDQDSEAQYLHQLAQGFGIDPEACNRLHEQLGAPKLYRQ